MKASIRSLRELQKLKLGLRVQVTRAGGHHKARWHGKRDSVFGATAQEAENRLRASKDFLR